ncbi:uncharacterized protein [Blastocystis hominis]|uniref:Uncharacterized protein n=1 Tax=Blastocystis hominis TaxID=12968 RepID=D8LZE3_BLAHO|nr:uncharacterized protein [Blastocystis hominis]CBK21182.2 unnamed protein product [Blastocystis hominis]|eukprot:XP_012895230.1 uncharacterized protein [Blastocystis hominis]
MADYPFSHPQQSNLFHGYSDIFVPVSVGPTNQDKMPGSIPMSGYIGVPVNPFPYNPVNDPTYPWGYDHPFPQEHDINRQSQNMMSTQYMNSDYYRMYSVPPMPHPQNGGLPPPYSQSTNSLSLSDQNDPNKFMMPPLPSPDLPPSTLWNPALTTPPNPFSPQNFRNLPPKSILKKPIKSPDAIQFAFTDEELHIKPGVS